MTMRQAVLMASAVKAHHASLIGGAQKTPDEFNPWRGKQRQRMSVADMIAARKAGWKSG